MKITLQSNNQKISAILIEPDKKFQKPMPALIFIHGWKSDKKGNTRRAKEICKLGIICLAIDLRGHGESDGSIDEFSRKDHIEDIKTAYKYLASLKEVDPEKIGIIGSSYGAYLAAVSANFLKFTLLILRVPALYFNKNFYVPTDKLIKEDRSAFRISGLNVKNSLALKGTANFQGKILIVESEEDEIIPHDVIENYLEIVSNKNKLTHILMKNTPHSLESEKQEKEYVNIVSEWLSKEI